MTSVDAGFRAQRRPRRLLKPLRGASSILLSTDEFLSPPCEPVPRVERTRSFDEIIFDSPVPGGGAPVNEIIFDSSKRVGIPNPRASFPEWRRPQRSAPQPRRGATSLIRKRMPDAPPLRVQTPLLPRRGS